MRFVHYSALPLKNVSSHPTDGQSSDRAKPHGLWFCAAAGGDGWKEWCETNGFAQDRLAYATEIVFADDARILRLRNSADIDKFTEEYGVALHHTKLVG
jgi:hypothetical protein